MDMDMDEGEGQGGGAGFKKAYVYLKHTRLFAPPFITFKSDHSSPSPTLSLSLVLARPTSLMWCGGGGTVGVVWCGVVWWCGVCVVARPYCLTCCVFSLGHGRILLN